MRTNEDQAAATGTSVAAAQWQEAFEAAFAYIAGRFHRVEPRRQARAFLLALLSDVDTRSCWQLAEQAGDRTPHRMQRLLSEAVWMPTRCATTYAGMWSTNWATRTRC